MKQKEHLSYTEVLDLVENLMVHSGIRKYCTSICKGACCESCYFSKNACHKRGERRLACSFFICYSLREFLFSPNTNNLYRTIDRAIKNAFYVAGPNHSHIYYVPYNKRTMDKFHLDLSYKQSIKKYATHLESFQFRMQLMHLSVLVDTAKRREKYIQDKSKP